SKHTTRTNFNVGAALVLRTRRDTEVHPTFAKLKRASRSVISSNANARTKCRPEFIRASPYWPERSRSSRDAERGRLRKSRFLERRRCSEKHPAGSATEVARSEIGNRCDR